MDPNDNIILHQISENIWIDIISWLITINMEYTFLRVTAGKLGLEAVYIQYLVPFFVPFIKGKWIFKPIYSSSLFISNYFVGTFI